MKAILGASVLQLCEHCGKSPPFYYIAARQSDLDTVQRPIDKGTDVNIKADDGVSIRSDQYTAELSISQLFCQATTQLNLSQLEDEERWGESLDSAVWIAILQLQNQLRFTSQNLFTSTVATCLEGS